jgi:hypothetical protein
MRMTMRRRSAGEKEKTCSPRQARVEMRVSV